MLRNLLILIVILLAACQQDPLDVQTIDIAETAESDGLNALSPSVTDGWTEEDGVLTANGPASLELLPAHEAVTLAFSFRLGDGAQADIRLNDEHSLHLPSLTLDTVVDRRSTVDIRPGVWQNLELAYLPAAAEAPALLVAAYLNGNLIYYQQELGPSQQQGGPLVLEVTEGSMSLTNLRNTDAAGKNSTLTSDGEVVLNLPLIHYSYYEVDGRPEVFTGWESTEPSKEGYISRFDLAGIRESGRDYAIRFTSDLYVPKSGDYTFFLRSSTHSALYIDDELVVGLGPDTEGIENEGSVSLDEGNHEVRLDHYQETNWNHLLLKYSYEDQDRESFNDMPEGQAIATPRGQNVEAVETDDRPYLLRSFLNFPIARVYDYTNKRTHVINVGEKDGPHYSYDLQNGALLQVWRGPFVDVSEMWVDRGEPQVVRALGPAVGFDGRPQWSADLKNWPDSSADLRHRRYELDADGRPTFFYTYEGAGELADRFVPTATGLNRTLTNRTEGESLYTTLAAAATIRETAPGVFETVDPGLNIAVQELGSGGLRLLRGEGRQRLVAELPAGEHLTYTLDW